jgi:flavin reductase (DIM6/NTAB) family NADH-FMN oxidoreductase RutF
MSEAADPSKDLAAALGRVPSGLFVLTARNGTRETGMLASWVQQCSFDPPQVSAAVRKGRPVLPWLTDDNVRLVVNVLPEGVSKKYVAHFGKGFDLDDAAFDGLPVDRAKAAAPVLTEAVAYMECQVTGWADAADHVLFILQVVGGAVLHEGRPATHVRRSGTHY